MREDQGVVNEDKMKKDIIMIIITLAHTRYDNIA